MAWVDGRGHRVLLIDGSGMSMPDTEALQKAFGQPGRAKPGCGFPVMHTLWLFDHATGLLIDYVTGRWNTHDLAAPRNSPRSCTRWWRTAACSSATERSASMLVLPSF